VCIVLEKKQNAFNKIARKEHYFSWGKKNRASLVFSCSPSHSKSLSEKVSGDQGCEGEGKISESDPFQNSQLPTPTPQHNVNEVWLLTIL